EHGACNRPPEWWPRDLGGALCIGGTPANCQPWISPGWAPTPYDAFASGVGFLSPRGALDQMLKTAYNRSVILKQGVFFSGAGRSYGTSRGLLPLMKNGRIGFVYAAYTS